MLDLLQNYRVSIHNKLMWRTTKLYRRRGKRKPFDGKPLADRPIVGRLRLALKNQELKRQAYRLSYKLRVAEATAPKKHVLLLSQKYAQHVRTAYQITLKPKRVASGVLRVSRYTKNVFQRNGRRYVLRKVGRHDYLRRPGRPAIVAPRVSEG